MLCKKCGSYNADGSEYCSVCKEPLLLKNSNSSSIRSRIDSERLLVQLKSTVNERYFITRFVGEGAFGQVFYAIDKATNSGVALKIFKPYVFKDEGEMSRLMWGIRGIKDISHPNLVRIFDSDISVEGWVYVSMRFIYGMSLANTIRLRTEVNKPFSFEEIEPLFFQMGEILNEMHPTMCHGDFKPSNIIIQPDYIKITDTTILSYINISNCIREVREDKLHIYLAPEVLLGAEPSYRSDIYSCGRILLTLLSGSEKSNIDIDKVELFRYRNDIDTRLKNIIKKATAIDPLTRHCDINEFNNELFETLAIYNELPQNIKDEYHQAISAIDAKFTHIKKGGVVSAIEKEPSKRAEGSSSKGKIVAMIILLLILVGSIIFVVFKGRLGEQFIDRISVISVMDKGMLNDISSLILQDVTFIDGGEDISSESSLSDIIVADTGEEPEDIVATIPSVGERKVDDRRTQRKSEKIKKEEEVVKAVEKTEKTAIKEGGRGGGPCPQDMIYINAGTFKMGSLPVDEGRQPDEPAFVTVTTAAFCIDRYEYPNKKGAMPKGSVSFAEADKLCGELGKRLCSEEEWERACKGVSMVRYPYDNTFDPSACNAESNTGDDRSVAPSGKFARCKSTYGVYDMSGNLAEWVYMKGGQRGVKGGYVNKPDWAVRCASRKIENPSKRSPFYGFRCCADALE